MLARGRNLVVSHILQWALLRTGAYPDKEFYYAKLRALTPDSIVFVFIINVAAFPVTNAIV